MPQPENKAARRSSSERPKNPARPATQPPREIVIAALLSGMSVNHVVREYGLPKKWVSRVRSAMKSDFINRGDGARGVAAEACEFPIMRMKAPRTLADFKFLTNLPLEMTYAERQRLDRIPGSWEILTESDGRVEAG